MVTETKPRVTLKLGEQPRYATRARSHASGNSAASGSVYTERVGSDDDEIDVIDDNGDDDEDAEGESDDEDGQHTRRRTRGNATAKKKSSKTPKRHDSGDDFAFDAMDEEEKPTKEFVSKSGRLVQQKASVSDYLDDVANQRKKDHSIPEVDRVELLLQVAEAILYLHEDVGIFHNDIRPSKVLITRDGDAKLSSFRRSMTLEDKEQKAPLMLSKPAAVHRWRAPELVANIDLREVSYSKESDVYAWGLVAGTILTGIYPFAKWGELELKEAIKSGSPFEEVELEIMEGFGMKSLLEQCWQPEAEKRLVISEVIEKIKGIQKMKTAPAYA